MTALSLRERRLVATLLLVVAVALVVYAVILPVVAGFGDRSAARSALLDTYARDERTLLQLPSLRRAAETQRRAGPRFVLPGTSATAAADALKERIGAAVKAAGGELRGVEDAAAGPGAIRVRADARATTGQLVAVLAALARDGDALVVVETLSVTAADALKTGRAAPMDIRLEVSGAYPAAAPR